MSMQAYLLTTAYFVFTSLMLFLDEYRLQLGFLLSIRHKLIVDRRWRIGAFLAGFLLFILDLTFPTDPGPAVLGDLIPALTSFFIALYYARYADEDRTTYLKLSDRTCAILLMGLAIFHFLFPSLILF